MLTHIYSYTYTHSYILTLYYNMYTHTHILIHTYSYTHTHILIYIYTYLILQALFEPKELEYLENPPEKKVKVSEWPGLHTVQCVYAYGNAMIHFDCTSCKITTPIPHIVHYHMAPLIFPLNFLLIFPYFPLIYPRI